MRNNLSLPYPVLGINDDIFPLLKEDCIVMADPEIRPDSYSFSIDLHHENVKIEELVKQGYAEYACEVQCKDTYLRKCYHSVDPHFDINLSRLEVKGRINFLCFIAAKVPIYNYQNIDFNDDYKGFKFDLEEGDLLALFPLAYYNTDIKFDKLYAVGSFMRIVESGDDIKKVWFNLDEQYIQIEMPHDLFKLYKQVGNNFPEIIHSSVVYNALVYALLNLSEYVDKGLLWADSIIQRIQSDKSLQNYDLSDIKNIYELADELLKNPYDRLLHSLESVNDNLNSQED